MLIPESRKQEIANQLLAFTEKEVVDFLAEHPDEKFYAFAFDCNAEYAEVNLCLNTEEVFRKTLNEYQSEYPEDYQSESDLLDLKYNTGDWEYQCFATTYIMEEDEMDALYGDDVDAQLTEFMEIFYQVLADFRKSTVYATIPKTDAFKLICLDHDDDVLESIEAFDTFLEKTKKY